MNFTAFELAGFRAARFPILHSDLDGLHANTRMVNIHREDLCGALGRQPVASSFHCGNHRTGIAETDVASIVFQEEQTCGLVGGAFLRVGGNFLRSVQSVPLVVDEEMGAPTIGADEDIPCLAKEVA